MATLRSVFVGAVAVLVAACGGEVPSSDADPVAMQNDTSASPTTTAEARVAETTETHAITERAETRALGLSCDEPTVLESGSVMRDLRAEGTGRYFALEIPAGYRASVTITPHDGLAVGRLVADCSAASATTEASSDVSGAPITLVVDNRGADVMHQIVTVRMSEQGIDGTFDLVASTGECDVIEN